MVREREIDIVYVVSKNEDVFGVRIQRRYHGRQTFNHHVAGTAVHRRR